MLKTAALCWFREEGEPARECWIALSDSDSEDSDYEATHRGGGKRGPFIRVVNTEPYIEESDLEDGGYKSDSPDGNIIIYPSPDHQHSRYPHAHLRDFSQTAIKKYNHDTGNRFEFVELVEASVLEYAHIVVIFKACQSSDDTTDTTSFRAETRSASKSLSDDSYDIETVVPLHSNSDISSAPGSESDS